MMRANHDPNLSSEAVPHPDPELPCHDCGRGPKIPGGYVCLVCDVNQTAYIMPVWKIMLGFPLVDRRSRGIHFFTCEGCHLPLGEVLDLFNRGTRLSLRTHCEVCRMYPNGIEWIKCGWCGADEVHRLEECPVAPGKLTLEQYYDEMDRRNAPPELYSWETAYDTAQE